MIKNQNEIKEAVRSAFKEQKKTNYKVGKATGITSNAIYKWLNSDSTMGVDKVILILNELGIAIQLKRSKLSS